MILQLDMLEEENEIIIDKVSSFTPKQGLMTMPSNFELNIYAQLHLQLRHEEKRREGAEARARELEKQVSFARS